MTRPDRGMRRRMQPRKSRSTRMKGVPPCADWRSSPGCRFCSWACFRRLRCSRQAGRAGGGQFGLPQCRGGSVIGQRCQALSRPLRALGSRARGRGAQLDLDRPASIGACRPEAAIGGSRRGAVLLAAGHGTCWVAAKLPHSHRCQSDQGSRRRFQMLDTNLVLRQMEGAHALLNIVILDACQQSVRRARLNESAANGPDTMRMRDTGGGLAQMQAPEGTHLLCRTTGQRRAGRRRRQQPMPGRSRTPSASRGSAYSTRSTRSACR